MEVIDCNGHEALRGLFKYRSPAPDSMGMMYVHILWLPFRDWTSQVNVEAVERGTTGSREAAVSVIAGPPATAGDQKPIAVGSMEEMFRLMREQPLVATPADDPKYDPSFPNHPLSQVRSQMSALLATLVVDEPRAACAPCRVTPPPAPAAQPAAAVAAKTRPWWRFG